MDQNTRNEGDDLCKKGIHQLTKSLTSLRRAVSSDVILVCQDRELFAHKLILQASSPYFQTLFNSGKSDFQNGRVVFKDLEPRTMDTILDFIYLRTVEKIKTPDEVEKVAKAASMLGLGELCDVCCMLSKGELDKDDRKSDLNEKGMNIHTASADVSAAKDCNLSYGSSDSPKDLSSVSSDKSCFQNLLKFQISDSPNSRKYEKLPHLVAKLIKKPLTLFDNATRQLGSQRPHRLRRFCSKHLPFLVFLAFCLIAVMQILQHSMIPNDFTSELLHCLKSEPEFQHGCIKAMFKQDPSTSSLKKRTIRMPGTGLVHFTFDDMIQQENELLGSKPQFSWKLTYYNDYRNIQSPCLAFSLSWWGKLVCQLINTMIFLMIFLMSFFMIFG